MNASSHRDEQAFRATVARGELRTRTHLNTQPMPRGIRGVHVVLAIIDAVCIIAAFIAAGVTP